MATQVISRPTKRPKKSLSARWADTWFQMKKNKSAYFFMAPFTIIFFTFTVLPVLAGIFLSFTYFNVLQPPRWIGWSNYSLLFLEDDVFLKAVRNTMVYAVVTGPVSFFLQLFLAWLINSLRYRVGFTLAFYAPSVTSGLAMGMIWRVFFATDMYGYLNYALIRLGVIYEPIAWLEDVDTMMPIVIIVSLWMSMSVGFLTFLAALQNMDPELYEAGKVDGVRTRFQEFWYITLPCMKPQLLFGSIMAVVRSFEVSSVATALTGLPSPMYATHTIVSHMQDYAFIRFEMGYASAISVVLFVTMFGLSRILFRLLRS